MAEPAELIEMRSQHLYKWTEPHFFQDEAPFLHSSKSVCLGHGPELGMGLGTDQARDWALIGHGHGRARHGTNRLGTGEGHDTYGLGTSELGMGRHNTGDALPSSLWTHLRVQVCGNAKAVGTWGRSLAHNTQKGRGACWSSGMGLGRIDKLHSLTRTLHQPHQVVSPNSTFGARKSHGPDLGGAITFPLI